MCVCVCVCVCVCDVCSKDLYIFSPQKFGVCSIGKVCTYY